MVMIGVLLGLGVLSPESMNEPLGSQHVHTSEFYSPHLCEDWTVSPGCYVMYVSYGTYGSYDVTLFTSCWSDSRVEIAPQLFI